jgi:hypothetical protein
MMAAGAPADLTRAVQLAGALLAAESRRGDTHYVETRRSGTRLKLEPSGVVLPVGGLDAAAATAVAVLVEEYARFLARPLREDCDWVELERASAARGDARGEGGFS